MNYLAHLFLAQPNNLSLTGNLMGDFTKGLNLKAIPKPIMRGIENHRFVDKFTDNHPDVRALKPLLSDQRRRFAAIISDVVFDHFLVNHWQQFSEQSFAQFSQYSYRQLELSVDLMPEEMRDMVARMISQDWLSSYADIVNTGRAIDSISNRIRFDNHLAGAIAEVEQHYRQYEQVFLTFFPQLVLQVKKQNIEL
ncbi:hypothetical protein A9Q98_11775 [Thalassotalea sp. 42_200_T64]|nr:hypothetical protein A9Q98_11775 [Thalassotalea sp. 42_200_T64]